MADIYEWELIDFAENKAIIKARYNSIKTIDQFPAANQWQYLFPIIDAYFEPSSTIFAILRKNSEDIFIMPISLFTVRKFAFSWQETGFPFHNHINLIKLPAEIHNNQRVLFDLISKVRQKFGNSWARFSIRNIEYDGTDYEYCGNLSYFDTQSDKNISDIISNKHNKNLIRIGKRINTEFGEIKLTINSPSLEESLEDFIELESKSWKGLNGVAINSSETLKNTYIKISENFTSNKMIIVKIESQQNILSTALCFKLEDTLYIHKISHNKHYPEYSPGSILILKLLEHCIESVDIEKLNLVTSPAWAKRWHPQYSDIQNVVKYNDNVAGSFLKLTIFYWRKYKPLIKSLLRIR